MSEQKLAEFMYGNGAERVVNFDPFTDANDCMLVEDRLREKGLWEDYITELFCIVAPDCDPFAVDVSRMMAATLEQRMEAAVKVIQESNCPKCDGLGYFPEWPNTGMKRIDCNGTGEEQADE